MRRWRDWLPAMNRGAILGSCLRHGPVARAGAWGIWGTERLHGCRRGLRGVAPGGAFGNRKHPIADHSVRDWGLRITPLRIADCGLRIAERGAWIADWGLRIGRTAGGDSPKGLWGLAWATPVKAFGGERRGHAPPKAKGPACRSSGTDAKHPATRSRRKSDGLCRDGQVCGPDLHIFSARRPRPTYYYHADPRRPRRGKGFCKRDGRVCGPDLHTTAAPTYILWTRPTYLVRTADPTRLTTRD